MSAQPTGSDTDRSLSSFEVVESGSSVGAVYLDGAEVHNCTGYTIERDIDGLSVVTISVLCLSGNVRVGMSGDVIGADRIASDLFLKSIEGEGGCNP